MRFITAHTSILVPKVFCAFARHGWTLRCYEEDRWRHDWQRMDISQRRIEGKHPITSQADDPRDADHPATDVGIANVDGGSLYGSRGGWYLITVWAFPQRSRFS